MNGEENKGKKQAIVLKEKLTLSDEASITLTRAVQATVTTATWVGDYLGLRGEERKAYEEVIETAKNAGRGDSFEEAVESQATLIFLMANQIKSQRKWNWVMLAVALLSISAAIILALSR